jgi:hypothetical protein
MEDDLTTFVDPTANGPVIRLRDTGCVFRGSPWYILPWATFVLVILSISVGVLLWCAGPEWRHANLPDWRELAAFAVMGVMATTGILAIFYAIDRREKTAGDWFVLDKFARALALPRSGRTLQATATRRIVQLHRWRTHADGSSRDCEVSVIAVNEHQREARYVVAQCDSQGGAKIAKRLAVLLGVPRIVITHPLFGGGSPEIETFAADGAPAESPIASGA